MAIPARTTPATSRPGNANLQRMTATMATSAPSVSVLAVDYVISEIHVMTVIHAPQITVMRSLGCAAIHQPQNVKMVTPVPWTSATRFRVGVSTKLSIVMTAVLALTTAAISTVAVSMKRLPVQTLICAPSIPVTRLLGASLSSSLLVMCRATRTTMLRAMTATHVLLPFVVRTRVQRRALPVILRMWSAMTRTCAQ